jgi:hypothetical protein
LVGSERGIALEQVEQLAIEAVEHFTLMPKFGTQRSIFAHYFRQ